MLQKIIIGIAVIVLVFTSIIVACSYLRKHKANQGLNIVRDTVKTGGNIFNAKKNLEDKGLRVLAGGPTFATEEKSYYSMVIDYGLNPTAWDTFRYIFDIPEGENETRIYGLIEADANGIIYKIE